MNTQTPVITVDGPSGVGKGTMCVRLAHYLGWHILDSGAMYRALAYAAIQHHIALDHETALADLGLNLSLEFKLSGADDIHVYIDTHWANIRTEAIATAASQVAIFPAVRTALLARQRAFAHAPGLVADGRDMGTVVFPEAPLKFFLSASPEARAQRRYKQLLEKGINANLKDVLVAVRERDERDSARAVAPLQAASDAVLIDTSAITIDGVFAALLAHVPHAWKRTAI
jgi:CMP/dCMP kinase